MIDFQGVNIMPGAKLAVATRRSSGAYLFTAHVHKVETREREIPNRRWNHETRAYDVVGPSTFRTEYRLTMTLDSNGRMHRTEWMGEQFSRALVVGYQSLEAI